jgi:hypothetical protein
MAPSPWKLPFVLSVILLGMLAFSYPFVTRGTATWVIMQLSFVLLVSTLVVSAVLIRVQWNPFS